MMSRRKIRPGLIVDSMILARQNGLQVSTTEMENAYLKGVDVQKVTLAAVDAKHQNKERTFQELVAAELEAPPVICLNFNSNVLWRTCAARC